ncbi:MAG: hypothetical protein PF448_12075 [Bacteroidales bacterium]|jgi:tetratricopeptide (TPR) repeat protein|nr:hypothetical protein [Bacteroidales bacterium]
MKNLLFISFLLIAMICNAQKREINNANIFLKERDYMEAYNSVLKALNHEKTKKYHKTYYYKFNCITYMFAENDTAMLESFVNPADTAYDALMKSLCYNFNDTSIQNINYYSEEGLKKLHDNIYIALNADIPNVEDVFDLKIAYFRQVPVMAKIYFILGMQASEKKDIKQAYSFLSKSIKISEFDELYDTIAYAYAGDFAYELKEFSTSIKYYKKVVRTDFGEDLYEKSKYFAKLADSYLKTGDTIKYMATARANSFKYMQYAHHETKKLLNFCIKNNYTESMVESLDLLESIASEYVGVFELKGELFQSQKEFEKALPYFTKYQELNEDDLDANYMLADCYMDYANQNSELRDSLNAQALRYLENARSINPYVSYIIEDIERLESELNSNTTIQEE